MVIAVDLQADLSAPRIQGIARIEQSQPRFFRIA